MSTAAHPESRVRTAAGRISWWKDRHGRFLRDRVRHNTSRIGELEQVVFLRLAERDERIRVLEATVRRLEQEI